ncbi:unnamed protein product [Ectocarpus fasciculatus]
MDSSPGSWAHSPPPLRPPPASVHRHRHKQINIEQHNGYNLFVITCSHAPRWLTSHHAQTQYVGVGGVAGRGGNRPAQTRRWASTEATNTRTRRHTKNKQTPEHKGEERGKGVAQETQKCGQT